MHYIYVGINILKRKVWVLDHEGDYDKGDIVLRVGVTSHGSLSIEYKPTDSE